MMNLRDTRERMLRYKLMLIAQKLSIDEHTLVHEAELIGMMRDAREAADEFYITINRVPSEKEIADMVATVIKAQLHA